MNIFKHIFTHDPPEKQFWDWFAAHSEWIFTFETHQSQVFDELTKRIKKVNPGLVFELAAKRDADGRREFIVSADGIRTTFPAVVHLVQQAPKLDTWRWTAFRPASTGTPSLVMGDMEFSYAEFSFSYTKRSDTMIDIILYVSTYDPKDKRVLMASCILLDMLLGEFDAAMRLGGVAIKRLKEKEMGVRTYPFTKLRSIVEECKKTLQ
jgi:hypothetical protein